MIRTTKRKQHFQPIRIRRKYIRDRVLSVIKRVRASHASGFGFISYWLRKWHEFFLQISNHKKVNPNQVRITCDTQLRIQKQKYVKTRFTQFQIETSTDNLSLNKNLKPNKRGLIYSVPVRNTIDNTSKRK